MIKLNRQIEFSLIALRHMANKLPGELSTAKEISAAYGCSFDVTARVLQILGTHEILKSVVGVRGGYQIIKDLKTISLLELHEIILGSMTFAKCLEHEGDGCQLQESCNIREPIQNLNHRIMDFMSSLNVSEILGVSETKLGRSDLGVPSRQLSQTSQQTPLK